MYFGARVAGSAHLWRQRFPDGKPEQITFGPYEEEDVAVAPDGRSLVTSVGTRRSTIWLHDNTGERPVSSEGYALRPRLSNDSKRLFYLFARDLSLDAARSDYASWGPWSAELRVLDLGSGKSDTLLPGTSVIDFDLSPDEKLVAFSTTDGPDRESSIWLASLDRRSPPRQLARYADQVSFGANDELIFRSLAENNALVRIKQDGTGREQMTAPPVFDKYGVSPDGQWVIVFSSGGGQAPAATLAVPTHGGAPRRICRQGGCLATWSSDGRFFYVLNSATNSPDAATLARNKTVAIPVPSGKSLPDLPADGLDLTAPVAVPGARVDRSRPHLARAGSVDVRVHEDGPAAQSLSNPVALIAGGGAEEGLLTAWLRAPLRAVGLSLEVRAGQERLHEIGRVVHDRSHGQPLPGFGHGEPHEVLGHHRLALYGTPLVRSQPARRFVVTTLSGVHTARRAAAPCPASRRSKPPVRSTSITSGGGSHFATDTPCQDEAPGGAGADGAKRIRRVWLPASVSIFSVLSSSQVMWMRPGARMTAAAPNASQRPACSGSTCPPLCGPPH